MATSISTGDIDYSTMIGSATSTGVNWSPPSPTSTAYPPSFGGPIHTPGTIFPGATWVVQDPVFISEEQFVKLQKHVLELTEICGELMEEIKALKARNRSA